MELAGKTAIITGASKGIGKDISLSLSKEGCNVVLVARTEKLLEKVEDKIKKNGGDAIVIPLDLMEKGSVSEVIDKTLQRFKTIDILINNAAVLYSSDFLDMTEELWDKTMAINLKSTFLLSQKVLKVMIDQKSKGYIINMSSTAAIEVPPKIAAYGISKIAVVGLSQALYEIGKEHGIKVSIIYPGMTDTEMLRGFNPPVDPKKWMKPEDITNCVIYLLKQSERVVVKEIIPWASRHDKI